MRIRGGVLVYKRCVLIFIAIHAFFNICKIGAGGGGGESPCLPRIEMYLRQSASAGLIYTDKIGPRGLVE